MYGDLIREAWSNPHRYVDAAIMRTIDYDKVASEVNKFEGIKVIDSGFAYHILDKRVDKGVGSSRLSGGRGSAGRRWQELGTA